MSLCMQNLMEGAVGFLLITGGKIILHRIRYLSLICNKKEIEVT